MANQKTSSFIIEHNSSSMERVAFDKPILQKARMPLLLVVASVGALWVFVKIVEIVRMPPAVSEQAKHIRIYEYNSTLSLVVARNETLHSNASEPHTTTSMNIPATSKGIDAVHNLDTANPTNRNDALVPTNTSAASSQHGGLHGNATISPPMNKSACCVYPVTIEEVSKRFSPSFLKGKDNVRIKWPRIFPLLNGTSCRDSWRRLALLDNDEFYLNLVIEDMLKGQPIKQLPFSPEPVAANTNAPPYPRALFLGDSISRGTWVEMRPRYSQKGIYLSGASSNCGGFPKYHSTLHHWLGTCQWDYVQFNVGMHFHPREGTKAKWQNEYRRELLQTIRTIHKHSPSAKIVVAFTTPSPLDTNATNSPRE